MNKIFLSLVALIFLTGLVPANASSELLENCGSNRSVNQRAWPDTDFSRCTVPLDEIRSGGPSKDGIPAIDQVKIIPVAQEQTLTPQEPVISMAINGEARAWPLRYLIWHEIANDTLGGVPIAVTYCPLCNAAIVFDRRFEGEILDFGTTGNLRHSDLVMYDRQTESWWQQYTGEGIFGAHAGKSLDVLASRLEDWASFKNSHPQGTVLIPENLNFRPYGSNPYQGYDTAAFPFLYNGEVPKGIAPLARVVVVDDKAWALSLVQKQKTITDNDLKITWKGGQNSALDTSKISQGRDVGTVTAQRKIEEQYQDIPYDVTFAFVFHAFVPEGELVIN